MDYSAFAMPTMLASPTALSTRILRVIRPFKTAHSRVCTPLEDYIVSRYRICRSTSIHLLRHGNGPPAYWPPRPVIWKVTMNIRISFQSLPAREDRIRHFCDWTTTSSQLLQPLARRRGALTADLANRFLTRKPFKSVLTSPGREDRANYCHRPRTSSSGLWPYYYFAIILALTCSYDYYRSSH